MDMKYLMVHAYGHEITNVSYLKNHSDMTEINIMAQRYNLPLLAYLTTRTPLINRFKLSHVALSHNAAREWRTNMALFTDSESFVSSFIW